MHDIYILTLYPIELLYKYIYLTLVLLINNYGLALIALSLLNYFLLIPLNNLVRGLQERESNIKEILEPQIKNIKETSRDEARHTRIQKLYERYSYHPIFAIRNVFPLLVQLPILMAVYYMVSTLSDLDGESFLFLQNLAQPDGVLFGLNIMPFIMTLISLVNACFVVKLSKSQRNQAVIVSLLFFALLYNAPSALLLYWTMNNVLIIVFSLLTKISYIERARHALLSLKEWSIPSFADSTGLFLFLSFTAPLFFTISHNINYINELQISYFILFSSACLCIFLGIGVVLDKLIKAKLSYSIPLPSITCLKKIAKDGRTYQLKLKDFIYLFIALCSACFITRLCLNIWMYVTDRVLINSISLGTAIVLFLICRKYSFKLLNVLMLSLCVFSCIILGQKQQEIQRAELSSNNYVNDIRKLFPMDVKLNTRANIYFIFLESYMNSSVLKNTYGFDNSSFENKLRESGFSIYNNIYSHGPFTKASLLNAFLMKDDVYSFFAGILDIIPHAYEIFQGGKDNLLFQYLKKNDYTISCFYDQPSYYIRDTGNLIDYPKKSQSPPFKRLIRTIAPSLHSRLELLNQLVLGEESKKYNDDIYPIVREHLSAKKLSDPPSFFLLKPVNSLHESPVVSGVFDSYQQWSSSGIYQQGVRDMNVGLLAIIEQIEKYDSNSVIILVGDHGHRYVSAVEGFDAINTMTPRKIQEEYPELQMTPQECIEDLFSVFMAIKMPQSAKAELLIDSEFAYADLFKYIFAALDNNPAFLKHKSSDISFNTKGNVIRRGKVIIEDGEHK